MRRFQRVFQSKSEGKKPSAPDKPPSTHGLRVLVEGTDPVVDIVAVHGLNGHRENTWTASNSTHWLCDLLPQDLPNARILAWGYDANTHSTSGVNCQYLYELALNLVSDLCLERELTKTTQRPILFVAHSLGGIIVKSALIHSDAAREGALPIHRSIKLSTYGILFMGTPHQGGSGVALGKLIMNIASVFVATNPRLLQHLERDSEWLQQQLGQYGPISRDYTTIFAYETYETPTVLGQSMLVVPRASAVVPGLANAEQIAIHADHINMVKFENRSDQGYRTVSGHMRLMSARAGEVVKQRWDLEGRLPMVQAKPSPRCCVIPLSRNPNFTGRTAELETLHRLFKQRDCDKVALVGLGGVGKTQVVLRFAYEIKEKQPECSIFWIAALSKETFNQACVKVLTAAGVTINGDQNPLALLSQYLQSSSAGHWMLVIDNADDMELLEALLSKHGGISGFFLTNSQGLVVFTTRHREAARSLAGKNVIEMLEMSFEDARELLVTSLPKTSTIGEDAHVDALLEELACHPLAITQAAAYLYVTDISVSEYLTLLRGTEKDWVNLLNQEFRDDTRYSGAANAVATTWTVSFEQIRRAHPTAAQFLEFMSQIESRAIPRSLLPHPQSAETLFSLGILCSYAFVSRRGSGSMYDMHRLVHLASQIWVTSGKRKADVCKQALMRMADLFPDSKSNDRTVWQEYLPHAVRLAQESSTRSLEEWPMLCAKMARCLSVDGRRGHFLYWSLKVDEWQMERVGEDHPDRLASQHQLAYAYINNGQVAKAIELLEHVIAVEEKTLGKDHPDRLASQDLLANVYINNGQVAKAIELLEHVIAVEEKTLVKDHPDRPGLHYNLAMAYHDNGQIAEAIELLEHVIAMRETLAQGRSVRLALQHQLATIYQRNGQVAEAIELLEHVVAMRETLAQDHPDRLALQHELAMAYHDNGQVAEAEELLSHVVAIERWSLPEGHPSRNES